ncbi:hypothetical protein Lepto7375DRAFT_6056 [Leptolyngbya sp. PCC 7375]|nr:hypothetical protein Lepto7375DRAFT_6056 [Leptolyngbya sp. PCC 7375]
MLMYTTDGHKTACDGHKTACIAAIYVERRVKLAAFIPEWSPISSR